MRPLLIIAGGGLLLWFLDTKGYFSGLFGSISSTPATGTTPPPVTTSTTPPAPAPDYNSLSAIATRLQADAGQVPATGLTPYGWNYSLARVWAGIPPDPVSVFPGVDTTQPMTFATYWSGMSAALKNQFGLSGMAGLGLAQFVLSPASRWVV